MIVLALFDKKHALPNQISMGRPFIVAIGSSAGGLPPLISFFDSTHHDNTAYVIIRHVPIDYQSQLHLILQRHSRLKLVEVTEETLIQKNTVYIPPASMDMTFSNERLVLHPRLKLAWSVNSNIDMFFESLAETAGSRSVAVILSGMGSDGARGASLIKAAGGVVVAQAPESCQYDPMPSSVIEAGVATYILNPEDMPRVIQEHIHKSTKPMGQKKSK